GRRFHAPLISSAPQCAFLGVVTRDAGRRSQVIEEHPGAAVYDSLAALKADGAEAVAISTPAETHVPLVREAVDLGLAVVCDKPFALDAPSAAEALAYAQARG